MDVIKGTYIIKPMNNNAGGVQGAPIFLFLIALWSLAVIWSCCWTDLRSSSVHTEALLSTMLLISFFALLSFQRKDAPQIQRLNTIIVQHDTTNSLKSERTDFGTTTIQCTSIVSYWPVIVILRIPGWSQIIHLHCKQAKSEWITLAGCWRVFDPSRCD